MLYMLGLTKTKINICFQNVFILIKKYTFWFKSIKGYLQNIDSAYIFKLLLF